MYSLWKDFARRNNEHIAKWNSKAWEEWVRKIRKKKVAVEQEVLLKEGISGKALAQNYAKRWHASHSTIVDNQKSYCENTKKEFKE
jgi:hypothetical protein